MCAQNSVCRDTKEAPAEPLPWPWFEEQPPAEPVAQPPRPALLEKQCTGCGLQRFRTEKQHYLGQTEQLLYLLQILKKKYPSMTVLGTIKLDFNSVACLLHFPFDQHVMMHSSCSCDY